jgi:hypothetical protein
MGSSNLVSSVNYCILSLCSVFQISKNSAQQNRIINNRQLSFNVSRLLTEFYKASFPYQIIDTMHMLNIINLSQIKWL